MDEDEDEKINVACNKYDEALRILMAFAVYGWLIRHE